MKKTFLIVLLAIALPLYIWDIQLFLPGRFVNRHQKRQNYTFKTSGELFPHFTEARFEQKGRNPFTAFKEAPKSILSRPSAFSPKVAAPASVSPPSITVSGIMWNPNNLVAIVNFTDGSSTIAKKGQVLPGGILVKDIQKNRIIIEYSGKNFEIKTP